MAGGSNSITESGSGPLNKKNQYNNINRRLSPHKKLGVLDESRLSKDRSTSRQNSDADSARRIKIKKREVSVSKRGSIVA